MKIQQKSIRTFLTVVLVLAGLEMIPLGTSWAQGPQLFLPLILRDAAAPEPVVTPFIQNGSFEEGPLAWVQGSTQNLVPLMTLTGDVTLPPRTGQWAAWLCGTVNEISTISQTVIVPAGTPFLTFWQWTDSLAPCGLHTGMVRINGTAVDTFNLCTSTNTGGWVKRSVNLTAFSGQTVTVELQGNCNTRHETISNLFLDDIAFSASAN